MKTKEQIEAIVKVKNAYKKAARAISGSCLLYTSPSPRDRG